MASKLEEETAVYVPRKAADLQRLKVEKLMKRPEKEVFIPEKSKEYTPKAPLEFIRNVWGSSAGAGSGDFHVYRGVRRREYARQKFITEKAVADEADAAYQKKLEENKMKAEEKTSKKRVKRLKKKQKQKEKKQKLGKDSKVEEEESEDDESDECEEKEIVKDMTQNNSPIDNSTDISIQMKHVPPRVESEKEEL